MKYLISGFISLLVFGINAGVAGAEPITPGITASPAISQINLSQNQTSASLNIQLTNNGSTPVVMLIGAEDFTAEPSTGALEFLGQIQPVTAAHSLAAFLQPSLTQLALAPGQSQALPVIITNAQNLAPGGHYAAITYKVLNPTKASGNNVMLDQTLTTLVFLTTYGGGTQDVTLNKPNIGSLTFNWPKNLNLVFGNNGNTQTAPRGVVQIFSGHRLVSQNVINASSGLVLPGSERLFNVDLINPGHPSLWPASYRLKIIYNHDGQTNPEVYQASFIYVNPLPLVIVIMVLLTLIFGIKRSRRFRGKRAKKAQKPGNLLIHVRNEEQN